MGVAIKSLKQDEGSRNRHPGVFYPHSSQM